MVATDPTNDNRRLDWWHPNNKVVTLFGDGHVDSVSSLISSSYPTKDC
ncbi:MAG: hypothetical protein NE334_21180 [Lentisphaeraceae bacterium]|nr:hypothetical protein [Lentisphaeraceae bacterium]